MYFLPLPFGLSPEEAIFIAVGLFGAAFVRGVSGFGFSALVIIWTTLIRNPLPFIPPIFICEILLTLMLVRKVWVHINWTQVAALSFGGAIAIIPSVWVMARLDEWLARIAISCLIFILSFALLMGWQFKKRMGYRGFSLVGIASGMANAAGVGGLPVALFLAAQPVNAASFRAILVVYLFILDIMSLPVMGFSGLVNQDSFIAAILALPILAIGIWLGNRQFGKISEKKFRRFVIYMLLFFALLGLFRSLL